MAHRDQSVGRSSFHSSPSEFGAVVKKGFTLSATAFFNAAAILFMTTITATTPPRSHGGQIKRLLFSFLIGTSIASASVLDAIAQVESGGNSRAVGDAGKARGAWQMHRAAWEQSVRRLGRDWPFDHAHQLDKARLVAAEHLRWLTSQFESRTGRKASAADQYALWNLGLNGYARRNWKLSACPTITRNAVTKLTTYLR